MEKVLGIVAEYNPFHNGHLYHLSEAKKQTGAEISIAVISGNFTQRGSTSIVDKWSKTKIALENGIDLVIELPVLYATSSAENFADGAIKILNSLNIVDYISFGAETTDIEILNKIADILIKEPEEYKNKLKKELNKGISFPKARENALIDYLNSDKIQNVLSSPNNILGIEYIKALKKYKSKIKPNIIKRIEAEHNDLIISNNIASSTAIRNMIKIKKNNQIEKLVTNSTYNNILENIDKGNIVLNLSVFEKQIIYNLRKMSIEEIKQLPDVSEGLEFLIKNAANSCNNLDEFFDIVKSKRYTSTRIQRILLYSLLGITKEDINLSKIINPYIRILGFNKKGEEALSKIIKRNPNLEIITSVKKYMDSSANEELKYILQKDIFATNVYTLAYKNGSKSNLDYTSKLITII